MLPMLAPFGTRPGSSKQGDRPGEEAGGGFDGGWVVGEVKHDGVEAVNERSRFGCPLFNVPSR